MYTKYDAFPKSLGLARLQKPLFSGTPELSKPRPLPSNWRSRRFDKCSWQNPSLKSQMLHASLQTQRENCKWKVSERGGRVQVTALTYLKEKLG